MKYKLPAIPIPAIIILFWFSFATIDSVFQRHVILPDGKVEEKSELIEDIFLYC